MHEVDLHKIAPEPPVDRLDWLTLKVQMRRRRRARIRAIVGGCVVLVTVLLVGSVVGVRWTRSTNEAGVRSTFHRAPPGQTVTIYRSLSPLFEIYGVMQLPNGTVIAEQDKRAPEGTDQDPPPEPSTVILRPDGTVSTLRRPVLDGVRVSAQVQPMTADSSGTVWLFDRLSQRILKLAPDGTLSAVTHASTDPSSSGDGGPAIDADVEFGFTPGDPPATVGADGSLYFAQSEGEVRRIDPDGVIHDVASLQALGGQRPPTGLMEMADGTLYASMGNEVYVLRHGEFVRWISLRPLIPARYETVNESGQCGLGADANGDLLATAGGHLIRIKDHKATVISSAGECYSPSGEQLKYSTTGDVPFAFGSPSGVAGARGIGVYGVPR